jgi:preprotein translocase subunit SecG
LYGLILAIHIIVCLLLVVVVLLQSGKSADLAGAFGGMGSQSTFGPRGTASFLSKMTTTLAILFMVTSLTLWIVAANRADSGTVVKDVKQKQTTQTPPGTGTSTAADTEKAATQQEGVPPAAAVTEPGTTQENKPAGTETKGTEKEAGQEKPPTGPGQTDSKQ